MAYLPPVVARLSFDLGDLDAKIDEAKAKIKSLGETVHVKVDVDRGELDRVARDLEKAGLGPKWAERTFHARVDVDDAMAKLKLSELTRDRTVHVRVDVDKGIMGKVTGLLDQAGGALGTKMKIPYFPDMPPVGLAAVFPALAAGAGALLNELVAVGSGFAAAGTGAAAFYALAHPAINNLTQDAQGLDKANYKLGIAQNAYKLDPSKTNFKALVKAQDEYNATLRQMGQDAGPAALGLMSLRREYQKITKAFEPETFKVLGSGIKLISDNLPKAVPFAKTFADSMSKWLGHLDQSSKSKGFQDFLKSFHGLEGPALQAITAGIGNVAGSIGRLLTVMSGKDVAHGINIAFSAISGTIGAITSTVRFLMNAFDGIKLYGHNIASAFDTARHAVASFGAAVGRDLMSVLKSPATIFNGLVSAAKTAVHKVASAFDTVRHDIAAKFDGVRSAVEAKFSGASAWLKSAAHNIANAFDNVRHDIAAKFDGVKGFITSKFGGAAGWLVSAGEAIMTGLLHGIESAWGKVASFLSSLAGKIKSLKGPLDYDRVMLYPHGQAIMHGLMSGMQSQVPALESQLKGITNTISGMTGNHAAAGGGEPLHVHVHLDGREITTAVGQRSVQAQRRTGTNGMTKRTR